MLFYNIFVKVKERKIEEMMKRNKQWGVKKENEKERKKRKCREK